MQALLDLLNDNPTDNDFGGETIPRASKSGMKVKAYLFNGYWEDIGTIKSFFDANLALAHSPPKFEFFDPEGPIVTSPRFLPPAKIMDSHVSDAIISHGAFVQGATIENAIVGLRSRVRRFSLHPERGSTLKGGSTLNNLPFFYVFRVLSSTCTGCSLLYPGVGSTVSWDSFCVSRDSWLYGTRGGQLAISRDSSGRPDREYKHGLPVTGALPSLQLNSIVWFLVFFSVFWFSGRDRIACYRGPGPPVSAALPPRSCRAQMCCCSIAVPVPKPTHPLRSNLKIEASASPCSACCCSISR